MTTYGFDGVDLDWEVRLFTTRMRNSYKADDHVPSILQRLIEEAFLLILRTLSVWLKSFAAHSAPVKVLQQLSHLLFGISKALMLSEWQTMWIGSTL
jgi:hypothetical protein